MLARWNLFSDYDMFDGRYYELIETEDKKESFLEFSIPGVKKEDISVKVNKGLVMINAEKKGRGSYKLEKTLSLPKTLDISQVRAKLEDGMLRVFFANKEQEADKEVKIE